ncbi:hypothetical protein [Frankia sp. ACN1ag]|uniref:hypothetical protein n=1 Tax=Frankia sp. ACN1ag TaxID=102891 RepID=UPI00128F7B23|nr:hypothetical protein [Frankia sp. ACN1ag]
MSLPVGLGLGGARGVERRGVTARPTPRRTSSATPDVWGHLPAGAHTMRTVPGRLAGVTPRRW